MLWLLEKTRQMSRRTLPASVDVGSKTYEIDSDFRTIMDIEDILFRSELTEEQKAFAEEMESCSDIEHEDACQKESCPVGWYSKKSGQP